LGGISAVKRAAHAFVLVTAVLVGFAADAGAGGADIEARRKTERRVFSDAEVVDGFLKLAFGAEFRFGKRTDRIRKFDGPVRIFVHNRGAPDRRERLAGIIKDIRAHMKDLDISETSERGEANAVVTLVRDRDLGVTMRELFGSDSARRIQRRDEPQCLAGFTKDDSFRIRHAEIILVVDAGDFVFADCAYEEILQALGPINDSDTIPWTMFNDDVSLGYFGIYDQLLLNTLYDPRLRPGMTRAEVKQILPSIIPDVRAFVARINGLPQ